MSGITQNLSFCGWLISLRIMSSRFIYVGACVNTSFLRLKNSIVCIHRVLFIHSSFSDHSRVSFVITMVITFKTLTLNHSNLNLPVCLPSRFSCVQLFVTLWTLAHQAPLSIVFSKKTGVGCHALLQGIFSTQGSNGSLPLAPPRKA